MSWQPNVPGARSVASPTVCASDISITVEAALSSASVNSLMQTQLLLGQTQRGELSAAASAHPAAQSQAQVPRHRERDPALDQDVRAADRQVGRGQFEARVRELVADDPLVAGLTDCMLRARAALWQWSRSCVATSCAGASCAFPVSVRSAPWHSRQRSTIRVGSAIRRRSSLSWADVAALAVRQLDRCSGAHLQSR